MATLRVLAPLPSLAPGKTERDILERVLAWLRDPGDVESLVLHAPNAHLVGTDGREYVWTGNRVRPVEDLALAEATTC